MPASVLAQISALKEKPIGDLKALWRKLCNTEPPPYNRKFLQSRLAYRIQELAYGGLKAETVERLDVFAGDIIGKAGKKGRKVHRQRPIAGTRLVREWDGVQHCVTVLEDGFEYQGRPYKSLSAIARAIAGTRWNGWLFFGLKGDRSVQMKPVVTKLRCAVYTRKSSEEGLDREFNSLDAQREACEAYICSQKAEGWVLVPDRYDDGGFSGGTLERPALARLLADVAAGRIDIVVVYKIDRLSRSLMDFTKLVEVFDRHGITFVSITQSFNTNTSMGRLTLNMLLSFAQFEREVIGERIRDKFAASRRKGMWMGGQDAARVRRGRPQVGGQRDRCRPGPAHLQALPVLGIGHPLAAGVGGGGRHDQEGGALRQNPALQAASQPGLYRDGHAQGYGSSR